MRLTLVPIGVLLLIAIVLAGCSDKSCEPTEPSTWYHSYGGFGTDKALALPATSDGGCLVAGTGAGYAHLLRLNPAGGVLWQGSYLHDWASQIYSIVQSPDGSHTAVGQMQAIGYGRPTLYLAIFRVDRNGNIVWEKTQTGSLVAGEAHAVVEPPENGYIVAGRASRSGVLDLSATLFGFDSLGSWLWSKPLGEAVPSRASGLVKTPDGHLGIVLDRSNATLSLLYTDMAGDVIWESVLGSSLAGAGALAVTRDGGFVIAGSGLSQYGHADIIKLDGAGSLLWDRSFGGDSRGGFNALVLLDDGSCVAAGYRYTSDETGTDVYLVKTDGEGNLLWEATYQDPGYQQANAIAQAADGGFYLAGYTQRYGSIESDFIVLKVDAKGRLADH